jgi:hypothetical protein
MENKLRASANVIHARSPDGNADNERPSAASLVPSSLLASGGSEAPAPNSFPIRLVIPISVSYERRQLPGPLIAIFPINVRMSSPEIDTRRSTTALAPLPPKRASAKNRQRFADQRR